MHQLLRLTGAASFLLQAEVSAARQVYKRWEAKSHALHYLEAEVARAKAPLTLAILSSADAPESGDWAEVKERIDRLERAISKATEADIPASGAKRVQQEMRAQLHAAQAAAKLEALMSSRPCGSASLKVSVTHSVFPQGSQFPDRCRRRAEILLKALHER